MKLRKSLCLLAFYPLLHASPASGAVVIDNMAAGTQGFAASLSGTLGGFFTTGDFPDRQVAFSFTTGTSAVNLTELAFSLNIATSELSTIQATISTGSSVPGGVGAVVIGDNAPTTSFPVTQSLAITPTVPIALTPSTTYWIHFTVISGEGVYTINNANTPTLAPGWSLGNTWMFDPFDGWNELTSGPQARVRMTVEAVPEVSAITMAGLASIGLLRRRRNR